MIIRNALILVSLFFLSCNGGGSVEVSTGPDIPDYQTLLQDQGNLDSLFSYLGAFQVPDDISQDPHHTFAYGGRALAYHAGRNSLYLAGHVHNELIAEISIPELGNQADPLELPKAVFLQDFFDPTQGNKRMIGPGGIEINSSDSSYNERYGGLFLYEETPGEYQLIGSIYTYYEAAEEAERSHFTASEQLSGPNYFQGMFQIGAVNPGLTGGYMMAVPAAWQNTLGVPLLTGQATTAIIGRSSSGPCLFTLDPADFNQGSPVPSTALLYYPPEHLTLGTYQNEELANPEFNMTSRVQGSIFLEGTDSILFFGRTGLGVPEYGPGVDDIALDGVEMEDYPGEYYIYDPASDSKGAHAWPYANYLWIYSPQQLVEVLNGEKEPWDLLPLISGVLNLPYSDETMTCDLGGAAYDPATQRIFISQLERGRSARPIIHVLRWNG